MILKLELDEQTLYVEDECWQCDLGDGKSAKLGIVFEAVDLARTDTEVYSVIVEAQIIPQPECFKEDIIQEALEVENPSREQLIFDVYHDYGGVPVNIDAIQPTRASCGASAFVTDQVVRSEKTESGQEIEVRHFKSVKNALNFTKEFYVVMAPIVFEFIDWILDQPLGQSTGWVKIKQLSK